MLTTTRGDILTIGAALAVYFASNGVESVRVGLNRAYRVVDRGMVLAAAEIDRLCPGRRNRLARDGVPDRARPLIFNTARRYVRCCVERTKDFSCRPLRHHGHGDDDRAGRAHAWLPAGGEVSCEIGPGIASTMVLSLTRGIVFGQLSAEFLGNYVDMYTGLASVIIALVFRLSSQRSSSTAAN